MIEMPRLDPAKCTGCGLCVKVCQHRGLVMMSIIVQVVETEDCDWCTHCEAVCPTGALTCPFEIVLEG